MSNPELPSSARSSTPRRRDPVVLVALVVAFILGGLLVPVITRTVSNIAAGSPAVEPMPSMPHTGLTQDEIDAVELGAPELWLGRSGPQFAVEVSAPTLDRDLVRTLVLITGFDDDGVPVATGSEALYLPGGESAWLLGSLRLIDGVPPDAQVADITAELAVDKTDLVDPGLHVTSYEVDDAGSPVSVEVVVESTSAELVTARVVVVVRDKDGGFVTAAGQAANRVSSAREESVELDLGDLDELPEDYSLEVTVSRW